MNQYRVRIINKELIAKDTWEISFQCLETGTLNIVAGQYVRIVAPEIPGGVRENSRIFSVILPPMFRVPVSKHWGVVFRASESAFKKHIIGAPIGTEVVAYGPFGDFTLPQCLESRSLNIGFVAGGVGIAPFINMVRFAVEAKLSHKIILFYFNKDEQSAAYLDELIALERENKNFIFRHKVGLLDPGFIKRNLESFLSVVSCQLSDVLFYVAGPSAMSEQAKVALTQAGATPANIRTESFGICKNDK